MKEKRLTPEDLAKRWNVPLATLSQWRWNGSDLIIGNWVSTLCSVFKRLKFLKRERFDNTLHVKARNCPPKIKRR